MADGTRPSYKTRAPQGYMGDWRRGAPFGRHSYHGADTDFAGRLTLRRVRIDSGGYDSQGTYFGIGGPLYWYAADCGRIDGVIWARDREIAKGQIRRFYPKARFWR
jgi:hypothetical protein